VQIPDPRLSLRVAPAAFGRVGGADIGGGASRLGCFVVGLESQKRRQSRRTPKWAGQGFRFRCSAMLGGAGFALRLVIIFAAALRAVLRWMRFGAGFGRMARN
jgi:hypothetical protein